MGRTGRTSWIALAVPLLLAVAVAFVVSAELTDRSGFCRTCHEMRPYHDAWARGPHAGTACVECHVDPGRPARWAHKPVALREVASHFGTDWRFPRPRPAAIPDARCVRCHRKVDAKVSAAARFSHETHAKNAHCYECHVTTGHQVSIEALAREGVLVTDATATPPALVGTPGKPLAGHIAISCTRCHDQSRMACALCHAAPHKGRADTCLDCHRTGKTFAFVHTAKSGPCRGCHTPPKGHWAGDCADCHDPRVAFAKTRFAHSSRTRDCARCHPAPRNHYGSGCDGCHDPGVPFARTVFRHPSAGEHSYRSFPCARCHPSGFATVSCTCHGGGRPSGD